MTVEKAKVQLKFTGQGPVAPQQDGPQPQGSGQQSGGGYA